jgi:hypothetical protein
MNTSSIILPTSYFPNIEFFKLVFENSKILIDINERYEKQTYRNRATVLSANGVLNLSVPVIRPNGKSTLVKEVEISYVENWQKNHLKAIESAYRNTPYFEFYWDAIVIILKKEQKYLWELNQEIILHLADKFGLTATTKTTAEFIDFQESDYRKRLHPKIDSGFKTKSYIQTFEERYGFVNNPTALDLLFNEGPNSISIISESY